MLTRLLKMCSPREDHCPVLSHGHPGQQYSENSGTLNTFYSSKEAEGKPYRIDTSSQLSIKNYWKSRDSDCSFWSMPWTD